MKKFQFLKAGDDIRKIGKEFQLISTVHTEGINNHIALTPLEALYGIYQDIV